MGIIVEGGEIRSNRDIEIKVTAEDTESLLFDWLSEVLYYFDTELFVIGDLTIHELHVGGTGDTKDGQEQFYIHSTFHGEPFNEKRHVPGTEVKAITYSYMEIQKKEDALWHLKIIFDI
jgi:SHS2 domain-containing protein